MGQLPDYRRISQRVSYTEGWVMGIGKPKTGRRASQKDRETAAEWVTLYRRAQAQPNGWLCLNPEDDPEEQTWLDGNDPWDLIRMLENFAEHGTFEHVGELYDSIRLLPLRMNYRQSRQDGMTHEEAIQVLASKYHRSTRQIERLLKT